MSQRKVRARDVDRDAAIDVVESAWADGQLSREEYEQRVEKLLRAAALPDLELEIADLQPDGVTWQPPSLSVSAKQPVPSRVSSPVVIALSLAGLVVAGLVIRTWMSSDTLSQPSVRGELAAPTSLLTPAAFTLARDELEDRSGSDAVYSVLLTKDQFEVVYPASAAGTDAVQATWNGNWDAGRPASASGERLSLGLVNAQAVSTIVADAQRLLGEDAELELLFRIEQRGNARVCITGTSAGNTSWIGRYDCRGQEVRR